MPDWRLASDLSTYGSPVPHVTRSGRHVIIPAGTLDKNPGVGPSRHVYRSSRAPWMMSAGELPAEN
jgi:hypothetical protein